MNTGQAIILSSHTDGSDDWHKARSRGIGGSEAATVLGMQPYGNTRLHLWEQKTGREESSFTGNTATDYGSKIEEYIFRRVAIETDMAVTECDHQMAHPEYPWMLGNTDGLVSDGDSHGILEIKTSSGQPPAEGCHEYHYPQIQHYLAVTGLDFAIYAYFVVPFDRLHALKIDELFVDDSESYWSYIADVGQLYTRRIDRDDAYIEHLIEAERKFWQHVTDDTPPEEFLPEGEIETDDAEMVRLLTDYGKAHKTIRESTAPSWADEQKKSAKAAIKQRAQAIAAAHGDVKKIHVSGVGYIGWNSRGYWVAKPDLDAIDTVDTPEVPF